MEAVAEVRHLPSIPSCWPSWWSSPSLSPRDHLLPVRRHVFPREKTGAMGLSLLGDPLGLLACHWLHRYRSETTQGYLMVFRDSVVNALALLGLRLTPGPCRVAVPRARQAPALEEIQCRSFSLCLRDFFWQRNDAKPWEYRRASTAPRNLDGKTPSSKPGWFSFWRGVHQHSSHLGLQRRASAACLGRVQVSGLFGRSGLYPHLPLARTRAPAMPAAGLSRVTRPSRL